MEQLQNQFQNQKQSQKQVQKLSQKQIQALKFLEMNSQDLREEIINFVNENPALELISEKSYKHASKESSDNLQAAMENKEDRPESLQEHLMHQLNSMRVSEDTYEVCQNLIYNLDKNGCYGSMLAPESFLDKNNPRHTKNFLEDCIQLIQKMDPIGTCCKTLEESLFVQAKLTENCPKLALFILNGKLELLNPPSPPAILKKLNEFKKEWHSKAFAPQILLDQLTLSEKLVEETLIFIRTLNPLPARGYTNDTLKSDYNSPDIILTIEQEEGAIISDDYSQGLVAGNSDFHFKISYTNDRIPQIRLSSLGTSGELNAKTQELVQQAKDFLEGLKFRESTAIIQGCAIVHAQKDFFEKGPGNINPLTRHQIAEELGIHESTVSRMTSKKNSRFFQTKWGTLPASYFFSSGIKSQNNQSISAEAIKSKINEYCSQNTGKPLSDSKLTQLLNEQGIQIARRTVAKYREQLGIKNSYGK